MRRASAGSRTSLSPCFVPGRRFAPLKIAASGARALLAMTNLVGFVEKRNVNSARKRLHPAKNVCFSNINVSNLCHCEERSDVAIYKPKVWHSAAKHGSTKQKRKPYHKKWIRCFVPLPLSLFQGSVSFRATIVRFGMTNRSV